MTTTAATDRHLREPAALPPGAVPVRPGGLLAGVRRECAQHGRDATCVARQDQPGALVFWCPEGHHFGR